MSTSPQLVGFVAGALAMAYVVASLFFLKFWRRSKDSLFLIFAIAFLLMAVTQCLAGLMYATSEWHSYAYLTRLAAFCMIIVAILRKNLGR